MRRTLTVILLLLVSISIVAAEQENGRARLSLAIETPDHNDRVNVRHEIAGIVSSGGARVFVIIQPRETSDCWVQNPILVNSDRTWRVFAQFGEQTSGHSGKAYEVRALANPKGSLRPGRTSCWPEAEAYSDPIYVVRK